MKPSQTAPSRGQVLPIALAVLMILMIFVPLMVFYAQRDSIWTVKQAADTHAFHLAESGVEKSYLAISQSTSTWLALMNGTAQAGYNFDKTYSDVNGGTYAVSVTSGPAAQEVTVISVGRDSLKHETRSLKVVYGNTVFGAVAVYAGGGAQIGGGVNVEWGAVMSPKSINANSRNYPQFWSASSITTFDTDPNPPNCDSPNCVQWHSFYPNIPPTPSIDFNFYRSSAAANLTGGCPAGGTPAGSCYYLSGAAPLASWSSTTSGVVFIEGDINIHAPGMYHTGIMLVMGNYNLPNGKFGSGSPTMTMPTTAWKQYGSPASASAAWAHYKTFDVAAPASFPGLTSTYASGVVTQAGSKTAVNGLLYVGGLFTDGGGGGQGEVYGDLCIAGDVSLTAASAVTLWFNAASADGFVTTTISLSRVSWQNASYGWPSGLP